MRVVRTTCCLLALALTAATAAQATTPIHQSRPLDARGRVEIDNLKGRIEVRAWDRPEVRIEGTLGEGVEKLEIDGDRRRLVIKVRYPNRGTGLGFLVGNDQSEPSDLRLMVPLQADLEIGAVSATIDVVGVAPSVLAIDSVSGDVSVAGAPLQANIDSVSGDLDLTLNRATVRAETVSGDIRLRGRVGEDVEVESVSGRIDLTLRGAPTRALSGSTVSGDMKIDIVPAPSGRLRLESVSGDVDLVLPRAVSADVVAKTFSGDLSAPAAQIERPRHGPGASFKHRYGQGSGDITIETFSGDVHLQLD